MDDAQIADLMDGVPHPAQNEQLIGHVSQTTHLLKQYQSGRMHHAWLLSGPRGIGKATLAMQMAMHVLRFPNGQQAPMEFQEISQHDPVFGKVSARSHPNLLHLTRPWDAKSKKFKTKLTVDEIRLTVPFFGSSRGEDGWRVTIVDPADDMNTSASNALLKILEEPPDQTIFFIISHSPSKILPTIRSRCQQLALHQLKDEEVINVLDRFGVSDGLNVDDKKLLIKLANGSVRQAILLAQGDGLQLYRKFENICQSLIDPDWIQVHALADAVILRGREDKFRLLLDFAEKFIETKATGRDQAEKHVSVLARWAEVWEKSRKSALLAESYNLDKKQVIINLFENMGEAARG